MSAGQVCSSARAGMAGRAGGPWAGGSRRVLPRLGVLFLLCLAGMALADIPAGDQAMARGDYPAAVAAYREAVDQSGTAQAYLLLAQAETLLAETLAGDEAAALFEAAAAHAREAIARAPEEPEAHFELARAVGRLAQLRGVLQSLGLAGEMRAALERTLELEPEHAGALHALAMWHLNVPWIVGGRKGMVRPLFEQAIASEPDAIVHYVDYGEALLDLGDPEAAREQLELALSLEPGSSGDRADQERARRLLEERF